MGKRSEQLSRGGNFFIFIFEAKGNVGPVGVGSPRGTVRGLGRGFEVTVELLGFVGESLFVPVARWGGMGKVPSSWAVLQLRRCGGGSVPGSWEAPVGRGGLGPLEPPPS